MMLNMYLALRTTVDLYYGGSCGEAMGVRPALEETYIGWQGEYEDPDVDADWALLSRLEENLQAVCVGQTVVAPRVSYLASQAPSGSAASCSGWLMWSVMTLHAATIASARPSRVSSGRILRITGLRSPDRTRGVR